MNLKEFIKLLKGYYLLDKNTARLTVTIIIRYIAYLTIIIVWADTIVWVVTLEILLINIIINLLSYFWIKDAFNHVLY